MNFRFILIAVLLLGYPVLPKSAEATKDGLLNSGLIVLNGKGDKVAPGLLADRWKLIMIGYTSCPDVCPFALGSLAMTYRSLADKKGQSSVEKPVVVFLTVDPDRDIPGEISSYVDHFHADFAAATGNRASIDDAVRKLRASYRLNKPDADGFYTVDHSAYVYIVAPDGSVKGRLPPPIRLGELEKALSRLHAAYRPKK